MYRSSRKRSSTLVLLSIIVVLHQILSVACERVEQMNNEDQKPSFFQLLSTSIASFKRTHQTYWQKFKTVIYQFQLQLTPPNLDFRSSVTTNGEESDSVRENMKEAVKNSIKSSEATLEETAKSAAEAVHKTADKVKNKKKKTGSQSPNVEPHDEL